MVVVSKFRNLIIVAIVSIGLVLASVIPINCSKLTTDIKYEIVKEFIRRGDSGKYMTIDSYNSMTGNSSQVFRNEENTANQTDFPLSWIVHFMGWTYPGLNVDNKGWLTLTAKDYQEFVTANSKGVVITKVTDFNMDGIVDKYSCEYYIVINGNNIIMPAYPKGFVDPNWEIPSEDELNRFLQRELDYWMKMAGKNV